MKKKPPPGATLIARLKEQRLAREAELAKRKDQAAGKTSAPEQDAAQPALAEPEIAEMEPAAGKEPAPKAAARTSASEPGVAKTPLPPTSQAAQAEVVEPEPARQHIVVSKKDTRDLLHREIDIDDLRPTSDDYFVLTDEIRLAGRFAAVGLIAQGLRLYRIREAEIYKNHFPTFEEYCRKEHQMSATYAYRLMRMAEMAEQVARLGHQPVPGAENMPDPFEVMISLGHRHIMALLPLEAQAAQELLVKGVPVGGEGSRVPLVKATEKQIRQALKAITGGEPAARAGEKRALVSEKQLIPALSKLVEMLEDWAVWLAGNPPPELRAARMGRGPLLSRLAKRFRAASSKIADALEGEEQQ